jgi:hypothetical protein
VFRGASIDPRPIATPVETEHTAAGEPTPYSKSVEKNPIVAGIARFYGTTHDVVDSLRRRREYTSRDLRADRAIRIEHHALFLRRSVTGARVRLRSELGNRGRHVNDGFAFADLRTRVLRQQLYSIT